MRDLAEGSYLIDSRGKKLVGAETLLVRLCGKRAKAVRYLGLNSTDQTKSLGKSRNSNQNLR